MFDDTNKVEKKEENAMMSDQINKPKRKRGNKKRIVIVLFLTVGIVSAIALTLTWNSGSRVDANAVMATSDNLSQEEIKEAMKNKIDKEMIAASMNTSVTFENSSSEGNFNIEVSPENNYALYVEIMLKKDETKVYKSGIIKPGYMVKKAKIDENLKKGTYECIATFIEVDEDKDNKEVKRASAQITIEVKE